MISTVVLIFRHILCLHLMNSEVAWVPVSSGTQVQPQIILDPDYLSGYLSVSYYYDLTSSIYFITSKKRYLPPPTRNSSQNN